MPKLVPLIVAFAVECRAGSPNTLGSTPGSLASPTSQTASLGASGSTVKYVFVITMENQDSTTIYGSNNAPYINDTLMTKYGYGTRYGDDYTSPDLPSEPHYIEMEAGTNSFSDHTFTSDSDPSPSNSTASTQHIVAEMAKVSGLSWMSYQENMPAGCPVKSSFPYGAKHDPFVFFQDVSFTHGQPDPNNRFCAAHHKDFATSFASDLNAKTIATYNYMTPNLCNDMHGDKRCSNGCTQATVGFGPCVSAGDTWLRVNLPPIIAFAEANRGVIFIVWDEAEDTPYAPFLVIGPNVRAGANSVAYSHKSFVKSMAEILGTSVLSQASAANDFSAFFQAGHFP